MSKPLNFVVYLSLKSFFYVAALTCTGVLLGLASPSSEAASYAGTAFEVELIIFNRERGMELSGETWPQAPQLQYPNNWVDFSTLSGDTYILSPVANQLDSKAVLLKQDKNYQVLLHKTWRQVLQQRRDAPAILISAGQRYGGHRQLEGTITLSVSHYLHLSTNLWLSEFVTGDSPTDSAVLLPPRPRHNSGEPLDLPAEKTLNQYDFNQLQSANMPTELKVNAPISAPVYAKRVAVMQQQRRLRSGELHYFDHPQLGVLIQIRKIEKDETNEISTTEAT